MSLILIIVFAFIGLFLAGGGSKMLALFLGGIIGYLISKVRNLESRLSNLEQHGREPDAVKSTPHPAPLRADTAIPNDVIDEPARVVAETPRPVSSEDLAEEPARVTAAVAAPSAGLFKPDTESEQTAKPEQDRGQSPLDRLLSAMRGWITTGNVPVKVGIIILFFGVAFLFKYAIDHRILVLPIELRLLGVGTLACVIFAFGWRLRDKSDIYALNLQGAGIGVLYLTIYAAFRLYSVLPETIAFGLMVILTIASGALAVKQNSRGLIVFASVGGFLAPLLASTGFGNHVALFSYYLIINTAILGVSWFRAWRSVNLVGFLFTFGVGTYWGFEYYMPELYSSIQPFLILNFLFYQAIAILFAFRQPPNLRGLVDGTIVFGTPAMVFSLQSQLVLNTKWGLAISAAVISLFYAAVATWLRRQHVERMQLLAQSMLVLAVGFATIALPLALDDRWSAVAWALEGAGAVWLGVRQNGMLARVTGSVLIFGSGYFYLEHGWHHDVGLVILNGNVLGGLIIACASIFAARLLGTDTRKLPFQSQVSVALLMWGATWWLGTGSMEIMDRVSSSVQSDWFVMFIAVSFTLLAGLGFYRKWIAARRLTFTYLPVLLLVSLFYIWDNQHLFDGWGIAIWLLAFIAHFVILRLAEFGDKRTLFAWHVAGTLLIAALCSHEAFWRMQSAGFAHTWRQSAALLIPLLFGSKILYMRHRIAWPLRKHWPAYRATAAFLATGQLVFLLITAVKSPGDPLPLTYIPLLNPFDLLTLLSLGLAGWTFAVTREGSSDRSMREAIASLGVMAFLLTTLMIVRAVHHATGVTWDDLTLARSVSVQAALSIYWAILGFSGMVLGARKANYWIWVVGVGLMVIVVLKLFFVDLGNTGTVARIVSFLGVGGLLMIVGYFAPRPPRPGSRNIEQGPLSEDNRESSR